YARRRTCLHRRAQCQRVCAHLLAASTTGLAKAHRLRPGPVSLRGGPLTASQSALGALALVAIEWLLLGWLSGVDWPRDATPAFWAPRWAIRLLAGSFLVALAQLMLALIGLGFTSLPLVLLVAAVGAIALRSLGRL